MSRRASNPRRGLVPNLDKVPSVTAIAAARRSLVEQAKADRGLRGEHHSLCSALPPPQPVTVVAYESPSHHHHLHLARVSGGGDHESLFRVTSTEVQTTLLRHLDGCGCNGEGKCGMCKADVCVVGDVPLKGRDLQAVVADSAWIKDGVMNARIRQLQIHNNNLKGSSGPSLNDGTPLGAPRARILSPLVTGNALIKAGEKSPAWGNIARKLGLDSSKGKSHDLWGEVTGRNIVLLPLNMSDCSGNLEPGGKGKHWALLEIGLGKGNEYFKYYDSLVRRRHVAHWLLPALHSISRRSGPFHCSLLPSPSHLNNCMLLVQLPNADGRRAYVLNVCKTLTSARALLLWLHRQKVDDLSAASMIARAACCSDASYPIDAACINWNAFQQSPDFNQCGA